jgi:class 3 adenylate cyclase
MISFPVMKVRRMLFVVTMIQLVTAPGVLAQMSGMTGEPIEHPISRHPFYQESTFHVLAGLAAAGAGFIAYPLVRRHRRRRGGPVEYLSEGVLVVDLVDSTHLATHYGDVVAMRARNILKERTLAAAEGRGLTFTEDTGDGYLMTFPSAEGAVQTAIALLKDLREQPPDLSPGPSLEVRAGISYGQILLDTRASRHGAAINKAFRLEGLSRESFTQLEGGGGAYEIPDRNRIFLDEEAAQDLRSTEIPLRPVGFCRLKGFSGLQRVFEVPWV